MEETQKLLAAIASNEISSEEIETRMKNLRLDAVLRVEEEVQFVLTDSPRLCKHTIWLMPESVYFMRPGIYAAAGLFPDEQGRPQDAWLFGSYDDCHNVGGFHAEELRALAEMGAIELIAGGFGSKES